jgi:hypothetical protein
MLVVRFGISAPRRKNTGYPLAKRLGGLQCRSSRQGGTEESVTQLGVEPRSCSPWPITLVTELLWIGHCCNYTQRINSGTCNDTDNSYWCL